MDVKCSFDGSRADDDDDDDGGSSGAVDTGGCDVHMYKYRSGSALWPVEYSTLTAYA